LSRDDAAAAYSCAGPEIRGIFPQADIFMSMVQQSYAPAYRHKSFEFGEARTADGRIAQRVHIVDANDEPQQTIFRLCHRAAARVRLAIRRHHQPATPTCDRCQYSNFLPLWGHSRHGGVRWWPRPG
jgi:hypothetical protein